MKMGRIVLGFPPWIEDPDPPDRLTDEQIRKLAKGARRLLERENDHLDKGQPQRGVDR
jgi:hypothetical protein